VPSLRESRAAFLRAQILTALNTYPTAKAAANALGITQPTLNYHMRRLGIRVETTRRVAA
jgi:transcriptional regulator with GAF, ATPase, and Fis domain